MKNPNVTAYENHKFYEYFSLNIQVKLKADYKYLIDIMLVDLSGRALKRLAGLSLSHSAPFGSLKFKMGRYMSSAWLAWVTKLLETPFYDNQVNYGVAAVL